MNSFIFSLIALLPPFAQSSKEIQAILADPRTYQMMGGAHSIERIERVDGGFEIATSKALLPIEIVYKKGNGMPGAAVFELVYHDPIEIR